MYYSSFGILAVIHHLILNYDVLRHGRKEAPESPRYRYRQFLNALIIFYISDLIWGFLVDLRIRPIVYADTMMFFASMGLSVLLWTRYVVAFLDKKGIRSMSFLAAGWGIYAFVVLNLIINFFYPIIFRFTQDSTYIPGFGRYILLVAQFLLFILISVYSFFISNRSKGRDVIHYRAVCASGSVMAVFIVLQTLYPFAPFYTIGCMVANCVIHIFVEEDERREQNRLVEDARKERNANITFSQIAESLASNYDVIYYIDIGTGDYVGYTSQNIYGELKINEEGKDFFEESKTNSELLVHPDDRDRVVTALDKDYLLTALEDRRQFVHQYRLIVNGHIQHTRFTARKSSDGKHMIIGVENVEDEFRKEREQLRALNTEKELARRDELTGTRNKTAFTELEQSIQDTIGGKEDYMPFAIVVCDLNDLKRINDTKGHKAGDEYIISAAKLLCNIFDHSPVFRIGGDEFAIFLSGDDYKFRKQLIDRLHREVLTNRDRHDGPVIAVGLAEYDPSGDTDVDKIFDRADQQMYEDKRKLKQG